MSSNNNAAGPMKIEFQIAQVANLWRKIYSRNNRKLGLSVSERRVLVAIDLHPAQPQSAIALFLDMEPQNLLRLIDRLEKDDYIERRPDKKDRRVKTLHLLTKGKKMTKEIYRVHEKFRNEFIEGLTKEQLNTTEKTLKQIEQNLLSSSFL